MKKIILIALAASLLLLTACEPIDSDTQDLIERSFRCMWTGDCQ